jgi:hypothetical protein
MKQHGNQNAHDVESISFQINITVRDADQETFDRLTTTIERMLRKQSVSVLIARNETYSTILDLTCAIIYPKLKKQSSVTRNVRSEYIPPCFKSEGMKIEKKNITVSAVPIEPFDDSALCKMHSLWSQPPWTMIYAGPGALAGHVARREGSRFHEISSFSKFALVRNGGNNLGRDD